MSEPVGVRLAGRMARIRPFYVMDLLARARVLEAEGVDVVHLEIGEPDFPTAAPVLAAGQRALAEGQTRYTPALGLPALRRAIADDYRERFGVAVAPESVLVTPGASGALHLVLAVLVDPGDQVLMADPTYPCNRHLVELLGGVPRLLPVGPASAYQLTAEQVAAAWTPRTRVVMLASPANPTGTVLGPEALAALHRVVRERGGVLVVDEIYQGLVYEVAATSALACSQDLFVINSFSKYFGMTGWRLGWVVAPPEYLDALERLAQNLYLAAPTLSQWAALAAFGPEARAILEERRTQFQARRDFLLPALEGLGFRFPVRPQGAFYLYGSCDELGRDSDRLARDLLEQVGVAVTPGRDFGFHQPERYLRFAYTTDLPRLQEGVARISRFLGRS